MREMPEEGFAPERRAAREQGLQVEAVEMLIRPRRQSRGGEAGRVKSVLVTGSALTRPGLVTPGHLMMSGTRMPPS